MIIYEFDTEERMRNIENNLNYVTIIQDSVSDNRQSYREFANSISIDYGALEECCATFNRNLLIDIYTYAEQLIKNFYYSVLEKEEATNRYVRKFINQKLDPDKFSPNVNYAEIQKNISQDLFHEFKFIITSNRDEVKSYNELIKSRHTYAHRGNYMFSNNFEEVIRVEKYISLEIEMIVKEGMDFRIKYQNHLKELCKNIVEISGLINNYNNSKSVGLKKKIINSIRSIRKKCIAFINAYDEFSLKSELLINFRENIHTLSGCDLRQCRDIFNHIQKFENDLKEECINIK